MADPPSRVFFPSNFQELFSTWNSLGDAALSAGGNEHIRNQGGRIPVLPRNVISLDKIGELRKISRTERYLEIGSMVKLNQIINLGKIVPEVLIRCLEHIAGPQLRCQATIGGNICNTRRLDTSAAMMALDAQFELRSAQSSRWISASRFFSIPNAPSHELLTRIRIPLEPWTLTWYRKFNTSGGNKPGGVILCILRNQKDILTDIRVVYSDEAVLREKNSESMLAGKRLPLDRRDAEAFVDGWESYLSAMEIAEKENVEKTVFPEKNDAYRQELTKAQILRFIEAALSHISD